MKINITPHSKFCEIERPMSLKSNDCPFCDDLACIKYNVKLEHDIHDRVIRCKECLFEEGKNENGK